VKSIKKAAKRNWRMLMNKLIAVVRIARRSNYKLKNKEDYDRISRNLRICKIKILAVISFRKGRFYKDKNG